MADAPIDTLEQAIEYLHEAHGHRVNLVRQHVLEGDMKQAAIARGEAKAYAQTAATLEALVETGGTGRGDPNEEYTAVSRAILDADDAARQDSDAAENIRGLQ